MFANSKWGGLLNKFLPFFVWRRKKQRL